MKNLKSSMPDQGHYTLRTIEMEVNDTDDQVIEQTSNRPNQGHFSHRRTKMAVIIEKNAFAGNLDN